MKKLDFTTFVLSVSSAAFFALDQEKDLEMAGHNIELLELMLEKTKGNLSPDEMRLIEQSLTQTRIRFVELSQSKE